jgi:hypothetical protein
VTRCDCEVRRVMQIISWSARRLCWPDSEIKAECRISPDYCISRNEREALAKSDREFSFPVWCIVQLDQPTAGQFLSQIR